MALLAYEINAVPLAKLLRLERTPFDWCPLCESTDFKQLKPLRSAGCTRHALYDPRLPPTIDWMQCGACAHVFTSGYFGSEAQAVLFSRTQESQKPGYDSERQREIAASIVDRVIAVTGKRSGRWIDVGCGAGALLTTAAEYGFKASGLDLRQESADVLCNMGYDARCERFECIDESGFDVVSMLDVVEHVPFPRTLIKAARERMPHGAHLLVSMPNSDSFVWRALNAANANPFWAELEHFHNFSRTSLYRLLEQHDFEPVSYGVSKRYRCCMEVVAQAT